MKHIVCHSGGEASAIVGIEVARKFGPENVTLVNHDINFTVEDADIKRFKREVAEHIGVPITYANYQGQPAVLVDQFDVCVKAKAFKVNDKSELCTSRLKTEPFRDWLAANAPPGSATVYYGFDASEQKRITRRVGVMSSMGYRTDYPLLWEDRTIKATEDVGEKRDVTSDVLCAVIEKAEFHGGSFEIEGGGQKWSVTVVKEPTPGVKLAPDSNT